MNRGILDSVFALIAQSQVFQASDKAKHCQIYPGKQKGGRVREDTLLKGLTICQENLE